MMKTAKTKLSRWKIAAIVPLLAGLFIVVACQDQVMNDIKDITGKSTMVDPQNYSEQVNNFISKLKVKDPSKTFFVIEMTEADAQKKFEELEAQYKGMLKGVVLDESESESRSFNIFEKGERTQQLANITMADGEIFTIVEEPAMPVGGYPVFYSYVSANLKYPLVARQNGVEGKVFIEFVITKDGNITDVKPVKGIGVGCDEEAVRVVQGSAKWNPGKQNRVAINQRMVLPITFKLDGSGKKPDLGQTDKPTMSELVVVSEYLPKKN